MADFVGDFPVIVNRYHQPDMSEWRLALQQSKAVAEALSDVLRHLIDTGLVDKAIIDEVYQDRLVVRHAARNVPQE